VFILVLFAILMILASITMIRKPLKQTISDQIKYNYPLIFVEGIAVGGVTGMVGAGGGFLIIPALVLMARLPMKLAVGTSLLIIALKSLIGFTGDLGSGLVIDYPVHANLFVFCHSWDSYWQLPYPIYTQRKIKARFWLVCAGHGYLYPFERSSILSCHLRNVNANRHLRIFITIYLIYATYA
jgi:hypothetical protein